MHGISIQGISWLMGSPKQCKGDRYGHFNHTRDAKKACSVDPNCAAIYDNYCDIHFVELCPRGYVEEASLADGSCHGDSGGKSLLTHFSRLARDITHLT